MLQTGILITCFISCFFSAHPSQSLAYVIKTGCCSGGWHFLFLLCASAPHNHPVRQNNCQLFCLDEGAELGMGSLICIIWPRMCCFYVQDSVQEHQHWICILNQILFVVMPHSVNVPGSASYVIRIWYVPWEADPDIQVTETYLYPFWQTVFVLGVCSLLTRTLGPLKYINHYHTALGLCLGSHLFSAYSSLSRTTLIWTKILWFACAIKSGFQV